MPPSVAAQPSAPKIAMPTGDEGQLLEFFACPRDPKTGEDLVKEGAVLFVARVSKRTMRWDRLSGAWEDFRRAMNGYFVKRPDRDAAKFGVKKDRWIAARNVSGQVSQRSMDTTLGSTDVDLQPEEFEVKWDETEGCFGRDEFGAILPLSEGAAKTFLDALFSHQSDPMVTGGGDAPQILWIREFQEGARKFESWIGRIVTWRFREVRSV